MTVSRLMVFFFARGTLGLLNSMILVNLPGDMDDVS